MPLCVVFARVGRSVTEYNTNIQSKHISHMPSPQTHHGAFTTIIAGFYLVGLMIFNSR